MGTFAEIQVIECARVQHAAGSTGKWGWEVTWIVCVGDEIPVKESSSHITWPDSPLSGEEDESRRKNGSGQDSVGCHQSEEPAEVHH